MIKPVKLSAEVIFAYTFTFYIPFTRFFGFLPCIFFCFIFCLEEQLQHRVCAVFNDHKLLTFISSISIVITIYFPHLSDCACAEIWCPESLSHDFSLYIIRLCQFSVGHQFRQFWNTIEKQSSLACWIADPGLSVFVCLAGTLSVLLIFFFFNFVYHIIKTS